MRALDNARRTIARQRSDYDRLQAHAGRLATELEKLQRQYDNREIGTRILARSFLRWRARSLDATFLLRRVAAWMLAQEESKRGSIGLRKEIEAMLAKRHASG